MGEWEIVFLGGPSNLRTEQRIDPDPAIEVHQPDRPGWVHVYLCADRDDARRRLTYTHRGEAHVDELPWRDGDTEVTR